MKRRFRLSHLFLFLSVITMTIVSISVGIFNEVRSYYTVDENTYYTVTLSGGYKIRCYKIADPKTANAKEVSVAWFWSEDENHPNPIPTSVTIPDEVTLDDGNYKVVSVFKGGFRSCTFESISLPQTVEEIREEAFAYCLNLEEFTIPHLVDKIPASCFMDCQKLEIFYYTGYKVETDPTSEIVPKLGNSKIKEIGDHAFDNCKKLKGLYFPSSCVTIGNSAFQRCELLQSLYFPSENSEKTNKITVGSYAFADCPLLKTVYFEENMEYIGAYAFANAKEDLMFSYTGSSEPTGFDPHWRDKNITTSNNNVYPFDTYPQPKVEIDDDYPGLVFSYDSNDQFLNCAGPNRPTVKVIENSDEYCVINSFQEPFASLDGYYDVDEKEITIPNQIHGRLVKSIGQNAFAGSPIKKVHFNKDLVQIQNRAFYNCNQISELDFSACEKLREISYEVFQSPCPDLFSQKTPETYKDVQVYNSSLHKLALPNCLEYIGDSAFYNFTNLNEGITFNAHDKTKPSELKMIGNFSFSVYRNYNSAKAAADLIDLVLPNSLDDRYATGYYTDNDDDTDDITAANFYHPYDPIWNNDYTPKIYRYAVGRFCFENQDILKSVTMEPASPTQEENNKYTTSFMSNAFVRCNNLTKFKSNKNLYLMGQDIFKLCPNIKEVFLYSEKAEWQYKYNNGAKFPWGIMDTKAIPGDTAQYDLGIFAVGKAEGGNQNNHPDTVIYVSGPTAPALLDNRSAYRNDTYMWNIDQTETLKTGLEYSANPGQISNKKKIPTFYNVKWEGDDINLLYWKPESGGTGSFRKFTDATVENYEYTLSYNEYNEGYIPIVPIERTVNNVKVTKYAVVHYFTDGQSGHVVDEIDLSNINTAHGDISNNLAEIAGCAFAGENGKNVGIYFILPNCVDTIGERAFFRKGSYKVGNTTYTHPVRIVTYKSGGTVQAPSNESKTYAQWKSGYNTNSGGYCMLPASVTDIQPNCFFNNNFKTIVLNTIIDHFGASAFTVKDYTDRTQTILYNNPQEGDPVIWKAANKGLYYVKDATKKTLVYQTAYDSSTTTLSIDEGTIAVGFRAAIHSRYQTVTIPDGLTTIYGAAFMNSSIKTVNGDLGDLKYISAMPLSGDTDVYDVYSGANALPFDNYDVTDRTGKAANWSTYIEGGRHGAFKGCSSLATIDFTSMTSIKAIGPEAFNGCTALANVSSKSYTVYSYVDKGMGTNAALLTADQFNPLDLSECTELKNVGVNAFAGDLKFKYTILPRTTPTVSTTENPTTKFGDNTNTLPKNSLHLIGDTYHQASIDFCDSQSTRKSYYPNNVLRSNDKYNFYRFYIPSEMPTGKTIDDFLAHTGDSNKYEALQYWTIYNGTYYLLKGYTQTKAFYNMIDGGSYTTPGMAISAS